MKNQEIPKMVSHDGTYETVPLRSDRIAIAVVQTPVRGVDGDNPEPGIRDNLNYLLETIDKAQNVGGRCDLLCFHEFPLHGFAPWDLKQYLRVSRHPDGPEFQEIGKKAKQYNCYIALGCQMLDDDWPGHTMNTQVLVGPSGKIIARHWKQRNMRGMWPGVEQFTTTIYDVYDRYVEMYGQDAVIPVVQTPLGNIAMSSVQREPELFRAMAIKGAEVILRTATGGFSPLDVAATALYNGVYVAVANQAISPGSPFFEDSNAGGSAIYGPDGEAMAIAKSPNETLVTARIPIGAFRARHHQPTLHPALYMDVLNGYVPRYSPNLFADYQPEDLQDAARYLRDKSNWK